MENFFDNRRIVQSLWRWKIHLLVVVIIAAIVGVVISSPLFITPKYRSMAKIFPVNVGAYSDESESEQLMEFISANDLRFEVIDAFDLPTVYKINREDPLYTNYILGEYSKNVSFKKSKFETIEIKVMDTDAVRACNMVDSIIHFYNIKMQKLHGEKYWEVYEIAQRDIDIKYITIDSIQTRLEEIRKQYGILDYPIQVEAAAHGLMDAAARNGNANPSRDVLQKLGEKGGEFDWLQRRLRAHESVLDSLLVLRDFAYSDATKAITYSIVAEKPFVDNKKAYPIRWLIVFFAVISALAVGMITVVIIDYTRAVKSAK